METVIVMPFEFPSVLICLHAGMHAIPTGKDEGAFAWLTLNYLLGKLGHGPAATVAAIDLGGGSVQVRAAVIEAGA